MKRKSVAAMFILAGFLCISSALGLTGYNLYAEKHAGAVAEQTMVTMAEAMPQTLSAQVEEDIPLYKLDPNVTMPEVKINGIKYIGYLEVPALELRLPIISGTTSQYLRTAPCRLSGSAYLDNLVIGAHNYTTHFGRLKELTYGDQIRFTDMDGNLFTYEVADIEILQPDQLEYLCEGEYPLSLYTCTIGGRTRLTLRCVLIE